jgi:Cu/Ag efflux protein CusF
MNTVCRFAKSFASTLTLAVVTLSAVAAMQGCARNEIPAAAESARTYTVRGTIRQLPDPEQAGVPLLIHHEAIDGFLDFYGEEGAMDSMTMPFAVAEGVTLDGFAVGDPIVFELKVDWQSAPAMALTAIDKLPAQTVLDLRDEQ